MTMKANSKEEAAKRGKYAWTVRVGDKGQIVIPKEARQLFDIQTGDTLLILGDAWQGMAIPPKDTTNKLFAHLMGDAKDDVHE